MKKITLPLFLTLFLALPIFALEGIAVIDLRTAVLATQTSKDAFKALEEENDYSSNVEQARVLQTDRQSLAEKLSKEAETLSQEEIGDIQRSIQEKSKDLEFIVNKIQTKQNETADKVFRDLNPSVQKILQELIAAKEVQLLLGRENILFSDQALDLTDDVTSMLDVALKDQNSNN